ncbi:hypothetical protein JW766_06355 [Candidatus Dojkabacteria bacterium]|nr:hypothetical protein [Candidatus Dojkabacteria bacterium]
MAFGAIYIFLLFLRSYVNNINELVFITRIIFIPAEIGTFLWFLASVSIQNDFGISPKWHDKFVKVVIVVNIVLCFLLTCTDYITDYTAVIRNETLDTVNGGEYVSFFYFARIILNIIKTFVPIVSFYKVYKACDSSNRHYERESMWYLFIASILFFIGAMVGIILYQFNIGNIDVLNRVVLIQNFFILPSMLIGAYVLIFYDTILEQKLEIQREFVIKFILNFSFGLINLSVFLVAVYILDGKLFWPFITISILGISILTYEFRELLIQTFLDSIKTRRIKISTILDCDVNFALKNFSSPHRLARSKLIGLERVKKLSRRKSCSRIGALRYLLKDCIGSFKPETETKKRTSNNLKYEILQMMAFEGATESQIMWDLGFEIYTRGIEEKMKRQREPRFMFKDPSEYSATSMRSFRRLKKEAIEMLRWKLEELDT